MMSLNSPKKKRKETNVEFYAYTVIEPFSFDDESSLCVKCEEIVLGAEKHLIPGQWILVQRSTPPFDQGYVPTDFLKRAQDKPFMKKSMEVSASFKNNAKKKPLRNIFSSKKKNIEEMLATNNEGATSNTSKVASSPVSESVEWDSFSSREWEEACTFFADRQFVAALAKFFEIGDGITSRVSFNIGMCYRHLLQIEKAIYYLTQAISLDKYFAIAYFERGNCYFSKNEYLQAVIDYSSALDLLKDNKYIDYQPLGLSCLLGRAIILINKAIALMAINMDERAKDDLLLAEKCASHDQKEIINKMLNRIVLKGEKLAKKANASTQQLSTENKENNKSNKEVTANNKTYSKADKIDKADSKTDKIDKTDSKTDKTNSNTTRSCSPIRKVRSNPIRARSSTTSSTALLASARLNAGTTTNSTSNVAKQQRPNGNAKRRTISLQGSAARSFLTRQQNRNSWSNLPTPNKPNGNEMTNKGSNNKQGAETVTATEEVVAATATATAEKKPLIGAKSASAPVKRRLPPRRTASSTIAKPASLDA